MGTKGTRPTSDVFHVAPSLCRWWRPRCYAGFLPKGLPSACQTWKSQEHRKWDGKWMEMGCFKTLKTDFSPPK